MISEFAPPAEESPRDTAPQYALPLVLHLERDTPPERTDALETAARAVLAFLADPRVTAPDGEWEPLARAWQDSRIRKVVRRARGAEWRRASELPGITISGTDAEVRVYPPVPVDAWPKDLSRLQVSGTDLEDSAPPPPPKADVPIIWLNPGLTMSAGKAMAQAGHGAHIAWMRLDEDERTKWASSGFVLAVRAADPDTWARLTAGGLPVVQDAGFTEVAPGSCTVVTDHPALRPHGEDSRFAAGRHQIERSPGRTPFGSGPWGLNAGEPGRPQ